MNIGPRVWKTGLAVVLALVICQELELPSAYLAVIAAIVSMKSSVSQSLVHAGHRTAATIIGGAVGVSMIFIWEANPLTVGVATILAILICLQLKLEEAIPLTGISVAAVMVGVGEEPLVYTGERLLVTLIGLGSGTAINLAFSPPRREALLLQELDRLNGMLKYFYMYVAQRFFDASQYYQYEVEQKTEEIRCQFEEVRKIFFELKEEIGYLASREKINLYEKIISTFYLIFDRILGIYQTVHNRSQRNLDMDQVTPHYQEIVHGCQQLLTITLGIKNSLFSADLCKGNLYQFTQPYYKQGEAVVDNLKEEINKWHFTDENRENSTSLLEISTICHEKEQIFRYTLELQGLFQELEQLENQQQEKKGGKLRQRIKNLFQRSQ